MSSMHASLSDCSDGAAGTRPPPQYSRYVGRVAALAVALGVGVGIGSVPTVALADTTGSDRSANSKSSSSSPSAAATSNSSSADSESDSTAADGSASSSPSDSSLGSGSDRASDEAAAVDSEGIDAEVDVDGDADESTGVTPGITAPDSSETDSAVPEIPDEDGSGSEDAVATDSAPVTAPAEAGDDPGTAGAQPTGQGTSAGANQLAGDRGDATQPTGAVQQDSPSVAGGITSDVLNDIESPAAAEQTAVRDRSAHHSVADATASTSRLFGDGTPENPNGGILFGNGFSWDAQSCTGGSACHGGNAGLFGGSGGNGFNGGSGGSAGWFGDGGDGGDGLPGKNGGNGGRGGLIFGTGGDGGSGGAALGPAEAPGRGGDGGAGGWFGTSGRDGNDGAAFPNGATPTEPTEPEPTVPADLTFDFNYGTGSQYWSSEARDALEAAAQALAAYFVVESPVTLTFDVSGENSPSSSTLAWASSELSGSTNGYLGTVVQEKILSGVDPNGSAADGQINFNFGSSWSLDDSVGRRQYDFQATAMHELAHTFGFISYVDRAGSNNYRDWTVFDSFIVTSSGEHVIGPDLRWNTTYNPNLTGGNGGLYFGGPNAVAAYGALVPLYTPSPWGSGSSVTHLDDSTFTGANIQMMNAFVNAGQGIRTLSPIELAIFTDLGYTMVSSQQTFAVLFVTVLLVRRRKIS